MRYKKILKRKIIFCGRLIKLHLEKHRFPDGYIADLEVITHPGAVLIIPFLQRNRIILIKQYRPVINSYILELPAGTLKKNETPLKCAKREMLEEIGYRASRWKRLGYIYPAPGYTTEKILIFAAEGLKKVKSSEEEDELIAPEIFTRKEVRQLLKSGGLVDAKTICALKFTDVL